LAEREQRLSALEAQIAQLDRKPARRADLAGIEAAAHERIANLRGVLQDDPERARTALETILDRPLTFTPVSIDGKRVYRVAGPLAMGRLVMSEAVGLNPGDEPSPGFSTGSVPTCTIL
jgi:hypothetical protein